MVRNNVEFHRIEVNKGGFCSKHKHEHKWNAFFVESGCLEVTIYRQGDGTHPAVEDKTILCAGDSTFVEPGVYHMFHALELTLAFETYWVELSQSDIVRVNVGGKTGE